jgi:hypothetical protein
MPANSFLGQRATVARVRASALYPFNRDVTHGEVTAVPAGGTTLVLPDEPSDGDFYVWSNPDNTVSGTSALTITLTAAAIAAGVTVQGAPFKVITDAGTSGRVVYFDDVKVWALFLSGALAPVVLTPGPVAANGLRFALTAAFVASGDYQYLYPIAGGGDDGPRIQAALASGPVYLEPGAYRVATPVFVANNAIMKWAPGVLLTNDIPGPVGPNAHSLFWSDASLDPIKAGGISLTPVLGSRSLVINGAPLNKPVVGDYIWASAPGTDNQAAIYVVEAISAGGSPWTVTTERPIIAPFIIGGGGGSHWNLALNVPERIHFDLGGGRILCTRGPGDGSERVFEFLGARDCVIENVSIDMVGGGSGDFACSFNTASLRCVWRKVRIDNAYAAAALAFESNESSVMVDCDIYNVLPQMGVTPAGIGMIDSVACTVSACTVSGGEGCSGFVLTSDAGLGCFDCTLLDCAAFGMGVSGLDLEGANGTNVVACTCSYNVTHGVRCVDGAVRTFGTSFAACTFTDNGGVAGPSNMLFSVTGDGTADVASCDVSSPVLGIGTSWGVRMIQGSGGEYDVSFTTITANGPEDGIQWDGTGTVTVDGYYMLPAAAGVGMQGGAGNRVQAVIRSGRVDLSGAGTTGWALFGNSATTAAVDLDDSVVEPGADGASVGLETFLVTCRLGYGCRFDNAATPVFRAGGDQLNRFAFVAAGGPVTVAFPIASTEVATAQLVTPGGSGLTPQIVPTTGVHVVITPGAGDTSTWTIVIQ